MKIFSTAQIRSWDAYTIQHEPIPSIELMNRASERFVEAFVQQFPDSNVPVSIFCGSGNNGGDGLAIARLLHRRFYTVKIWLCTFSAACSDDFQTQLALLPDAIERKLWHSEISIKTGILIDALLGSGLNRPLSGDFAKVVEHINSLNLPTVAVDVPSGLFSEKPTEGIAVEADKTFTFQCPKLAFFFQENEKYIGDWDVLDIGLHPDFEAAEESGFAVQNTLPVTLKKRGKFSHKGTFGHALLVGGSVGMVGAMVMATRAALRSGVGLVTAQVPDSERFVLQISNPEALCIGFYLETDVSKYQAIGLGCGWGTGPEAKGILDSILSQKNLPPLVLDADALNFISTEKKWLERLPARTILTPHPKEFERLFGKSENGFEQLELLRDRAKKYQLILVLKGAYTKIALPDGSVHFNPAATSGLAKGGTGDVLTGLITGLLAQGYAPEEATRLGIFLHGKAGEKAAATLGELGMTAMDLPNYFWA